jgi:hypothetical protein
LAEADAGTEPVSSSEEGLRRSRLGIAVVCGAVAALQLSYGVALQDDAYISFRYAWNLARGNGLVFNAGERVEGYTNFLWTVLFTPAELVGLDPAVPAILLGVAFTAALLHATWRLGRGRLLAPALVACFPGLALEGVQGLETVFYAWLLTMALIGGRNWAVWSGLAALTRPEGYAFFGLLWLLRRGWTDRRATLLFPALTVPHLLFRVGYYGDIVPNTFHAKVGDPTQLAGAAWQRGLGYLWRNASSSAPTFLLFVLGVPVLLAKRLLPREAHLREAAAMVAFVVVYVLAVGGDFKGTGRFVIPVLPAVAVLAQRAVDELVSHRGNAYRDGIFAGLAAAALLASVPGFQAMRGFAEHFATDLQDRMLVGQTLKQKLPADTLIAVHAAGILPYYAELPTLDMWGLNDAHIARADVENLGEGIAGHERHDYAYVLSREPHIILTEKDLVTPVPIVLGDPGVFPPAFQTDYAPASMPLPDGRHMNAWIRRRDP